MPPAHLDNQSRNCGAKTVVVKQSSVTVEGRLWAVRGDPNSHGKGELINTYDGITIEGFPVIVHTPDPASADGLCPFFGGPHCNPKTAEGSSALIAYG